MNELRIETPAGKSRVLRASLLAGTAAVLAVLVTAPAQAQTAREVQLERRLQTLERELQTIKTNTTPTQREAALEKRVVELENEIKNIKTVAPERMVRGGRRDVTVELYGQVNRGVVIVDDGYRTSLSNVDNDASSTRFGMRATSPKIASTDINFGANIELEIQSNPSNVINQFDTKSSSPSVDERKLEAWVESKTFGKIWIGQGDMASNNSAEQDLSGTAVATGYSDIETTAGGFLFANNALQANVPYSTSSTLSPSIADVFNNLDGLSRQDRVRYDTPKFFGFSAATSIASTIGGGSGAGKDVALYYSGKLGPVQVAAATAAAFTRPSDSNVNANNGQNIYDGSISALHDWGLNLTFAAGSTANNGTGREPRQYYYIKAGYLADFFDIGKTAFAIDWTEQVDQRQNGDYAKSIGGYIVQNFARQGTEAYLAIRSHSLDADTGDYDSVLAVLTGLRVRF
jgi:hypothetical protein